MRKIAIAIVTLLLGLLVYVTLFKGLHIFKIQIPNISGIKQKSISLDEKINEAEQLVLLDYVQTSKKLDTSLTKLSEQRKSYEEKVALCTPEEIEQATKVGKYEIEYLWATVGNYASKEEVELKMDVISNGTSNTNNLNFTIKGSYIGITDFLYDVEGDQTLQFKVENFKLIPATSTDSLEATFVVRDVTVNIDGKIATTKVTDNILDKEENKEESKAVSSDTVEASKE